MNIDAKILNKVLAAEHSNASERSYTIIKVGFIPVVQGRYNIHKSLNVIHRINKSKDKNHMIISIDSEKTFDKEQHPFMIQTLSKVGVEGALLNIIKAIYEKPTASIIVNWQKLKGLALRQE